MEQEQAKWICSRRRRDENKTGIADRSAIIAYFAEQSAPISAAATRDSVFSITQSPASIARASKADGPLYRGMIVSGDEMSKQHETGCGYTGSEPAPPT